MHDPRLRWRKALPVTVEREQDQFVLWSHAIQQWGAGGSFSEAVDDLVRSVAHDYWQFIKLSDARLSPHLQRVKRNLKRYLEPRP